MAQSLEAVKSALPLPHKRRGPMAVTWNNATIVYGGYAPEEPRIDQLSVVFYHKSGKWTKKHTYGEFPKWSQLSGAHVVNDKIFVFDSDEGKMVVYSLDLHTWIWEILIPSSTSPFGKGSIIASWVYNRMIYCFGGLGFGAGAHASNQLFCYNISTNSWEWPNARGDIPSPRFAPSVVISKDTVFIFGGIGDGNTYNDLYILDMVSMRWRRVHGNLPIGEGPTKIRKPTLTCFSQSTALLLGCTTVHNPPISWPVNNSWLLNLHNAKQLMAPSSIWTNLPNHPSRCCHATVLQPLSKRLWVMGGHDGTLNCLDKGGFTSNVMKVKVFQLWPLKDLAIEHLAKSLCANYSRLAPDQLPKELKKNIEAYQCENGNE